MPRLLKKQSNECTRRWNPCRICGRHTVARDKICTQSEKCQEARRVLREFRHSGMPRRVPVTEVRALLPGTTMSASELGIMLGYGHKAIRRCATKRCLLIRRWRLTDVPLYYPAEHNWRQCRAACLLLAFPEKNIHQIARLAGLKPNTIFTDIRKLGAKFVWCDRLHPQAK